MHMIFLKVIHMRKLDIYQSFWGILHMHYITAERMLLKHGRAERRNEKKNTRNISKSAEQ